MGPGTGTGWSASQEMLLQPARSQGRGVGVGGKRWVQEERYKAEVGESPALSCSRSQVIPGPPQEYQACLRSGDKMPSFHCFGEELKVGRALVLPPWELRGRPLPR